MGSVHELDFGGKRDDVASAAMDDLVRALGRVVEMRIKGDATFAEREVVTLQVSNMATRGQLEQELQRVMVAQSDDLLINGVRYKQSHEPTTGKYHSLCGTLEVQRATYREVGVRNGPTVVPLELEVGMVERATPALGYSISLEYANKTSREYVESMAAAHREVPSRSTVERIGKAVGTKAKASAPSIERYLRKSEKVPEEAIAISVGLDRTSVTDQRDPVPRSPLVRPPFPPLWALALVPRGQPVPEAAAGGSGPGGGFQCMGRRSSSFEFGWERTRTATSRMYS